MTLPCNDVRSSFCVEMVEALDLIDEMKPILVRVSIIQFLGLVNDLPGVILCWHVRDQMPTHGVGSDRARGR